MTPLKDPLVWIDCEMTGLDLTEDALVEVAVIITDAQLNLVDDGIDLIITPRPGALEHMNDFVRDMHTTSGLLDAIETEGVSLEQAQELVLAYITERVPEPRKGLLAGNSIGTDKMFLEKEMPNVMEHLHYRVIDVSSIKELAKRWYPRTFYQAPAKHGGHRALADIRESIQELRYYRKVLFPTDEGPSTAACQQAAADVLAQGLGTPAPAKY